MKPLYKSMLVAGAMFAMSATAFADNNTQRSGRAGDIAPYGATSTYNTNSAAAVSSRLTKDQIMELQETLNDRGYSLTADGVWGNQTAASLRRFQRENNLSETGTLNAETADLLDIEVSSITDDASGSTTRANR